MAITVTEKIKEILKARDARISDGTTAVLDLLAEVRRQIVSELISTSPGSYSAWRMKAVLNSIEKHLADWQSAASREVGDGIAASWEAGKGLLPAVLAVTETQAGNIWISGHTLEALKDFAFGRIASVGGDVYTKIKGELTLGILGQKTPQEVAWALAGDIKDMPLPKNRWGHPIFKTTAERAEVITGTEMGRAFSLATELSINAAQETVPDMKRMWLHAGHPKAPRMIHLAMHGQVRKVGKPFYKVDGNGYGVLYPRDPNAPIKEVIRCGCTHVPYMKEWGDAQAFAADFDSKQAQANKPRRT